MQPLWSILASAFKILILYPFVSVVAECCWQAALLVLEFLQNCCWIQLRSCWGQQLLAPVMKAATGSLPEHDVQTDCMLVRTIACVTLFVGVFQPAIYIRLYI
jgi:hypothetical protein